MSVTTTELQKPPLPADFTPDSSVVMERQATINIGAIGHVAHGKSTVVHAITGVDPTKFSREKMMNITIHLGYGNAKIYRSPNLELPGNYFAFGSSVTNPKCPVTGELLQLVRHVSFVDCPGHDVLMATMLNGASIMDAALLLVAANEPFPQPQTKEHLSAIEIMRLSSVLVLQNKIDLVKATDAAEQGELIRRFLKNETMCAKAPIIPISAQHKVNIDVVLEYICHFPIPKRDLKCPAKMIIIRSFDVNKPGEDISKLKGGVAGGSIQCGALFVGQPIEVKPGLIVRTAPEQSGDKESFCCTPIRSVVVSLFAEHNQLDVAIAGGLIGVGTNIDPTLTRLNKLVGHLLGDPGTLPKVFVELEITVVLLTVLVGVKPISPKAVPIPRLVINEQLQLNIGTLTAGCVVKGIVGGLAKLWLHTPVCCVAGDQVTISRRIGEHFRLIGWGKVRRGKDL